MTEFHGKFENMTDKEKDLIINPKHYEIIPAGNYPEGIEYIDICVHALSHLSGVQALAVGQILKYSLRLGKKDSLLQDASKIAWYADYLVKTIEKEISQANNSKNKKEK